MTKKEANKILYYIEDEGFDYTIRMKSSWSEIKDNEFHLLRQQYLDSLTALSEYLNEQSES